MSVCPFCEVKLANSARWRHHIATNACRKVPLNCAVPAGVRQSREHFKGGFHRYREEDK